MFVGRAKLLLSRERMRLGGSLALPFATHGARHTYVLLAGRPDPSADLGVTGFWA